MNKIYTYVAAIEHVIDGDTIELNIDLGFDAWIQEKVRLRGIDTPAITTHRGRMAKKYWIIRVFVNAKRRIQGIPIG